MRALPGWEQRAVSADDVVRHLRSGTRAFVHGAAATPTELLEAMARRRDLEDVRLHHLHTSGPSPFAAADQRGRLRSISLFTGPALRAPIAEGRADFVPIFLSDIPGLFRTRQIALDAAIVSLSPPDVNGHCTLGTSIDAAKAATETAPIILAEINERMPRTHGRTIVPFDRLTAFVRTDRPLHEHPPTSEGPVEARIGELVAGLVEDGATLQLGIGAIPDAVLTRLQDKRDLGVHTEMFSDNLVDLVRSGAVTNRFKRVHQGRTVTSFVTGTRRVYDFVDDNLTVEFHPCDRTNDTALIRQNPKVVAVNSAIEIDLTGQVCADSMGHTIYSGIGGQMDFIHGAALSEGGKPIIALPSTAAQGKVSRIVSCLKAGAGVVTTRGHVHWVVTEVGAVNLHGLTLRERAEALISIASPDFRAELRREANQLRHFDWDNVRGMSDAKRRHPHVVNISETQGSERLTGSRFGFRFKQLSEPAGGRAIGCSWYEIPPARAAYPYHFHCLNEEAMYVLEGEGTVRIGPDEVRVRAGDYLAFPVGPATAHQVLNHGTAPLRLIALSTKLNGDLVGYPDSKKVAATASPPGARFGEPPWIRLIVPEGTSVDYFQGEKLD